jgi:DNA-nicking Smr family endonuclease
MPIPELDLHGLTKEEALVETDREVNHLFCRDSDDRRLRIITGWGHVLRPAIREFLVDHPLVKEIREEGPTMCITLEELS